MSSPIKRESIFSISASSLLRSSTTGCNNCLRLNASNCRVTTAARSGLGHLFERFAQVDYHGAVPPS